MHKIKNLLLIEDNEGDVFLLKAAFRELNYDFNIHVERNGEGAIQYIDNIIKTKINLPELVFLDLNIPGYNGHEILEAIRKKEGLKSLPIIILSSSSNPKDIGDSYKKGANSYIQKTFHFHDMVTQINNALKNY